MIKAGLLLPVAWDSIFRMLYAESDGEAKLEHFGLQLSTITSMLAQDFEGTLETVARIGYDQVEFSALGLLGRSADEVKSLLQKYGLEAPVGRVSVRMPAGFMSMPREQQMKFYASRGGINTLIDRIGHSIEEAKIFGQKYLIIPAIMPSSFSSKLQIEKMMEVIREGCEMCSQADIKLGYHNHHWEFQEVDGILPFDFMVMETDRENFTFQLDTYWVKKAGFEPIDYLEKYPGRFETCHFKDITAEGDFADVGHGLLSFPLFTKAALAQGAKYFFVERDTSPDALASIKQSYQYLKEMQF